jgi:hypothetical protein
LNIHFNSGPLTRELVTHKNDKRKSKEIKGNRWISKVRQMRLFSTSSNFETPSSREDMENVPPALSSSSVCSGMAWVSADERLAIDVSGFNQDAPMSKFIYIMGASDICKASAGRNHPDTDPECGSLGCFEKERKEILMVSISILGEGGIYKTSTEVIR